MNSGSLFILAKSYIYTVYSELIMFHPWGSRGQGIYKQVTPFVAYSRLSNFKLSSRDSILWYVGVKRYTYLTIRYVSRYFSTIRFFFRYDTIT